MGGGAATAAKPTSEEKAATAAQTALLQQEQARITDLQSALKSSSALAAQQMGVGPYGSQFDRTVGQALASGSPGTFGATYQQQAPQAPPDPGAQMSYEQLHQAWGLAPDSEHPNTAAANQRIYQNYLSQYQQQKGTFDAYQQAYGPGSGFGTPGTSRVGYEAGTVASMVKQISDQVAGGNDAIAQTFEAKLQSALQELPEEGQAKQALLQRVLQLTASPEGQQTFNQLFGAVQQATTQGAAAQQALYERLSQLTGPEGQKIYGDLLARVGRGAAGEEPIDPAVARDLARQEAILGNTLQKQLGPGYAASTAGAMRLGDYAQMRAQAIATDQRQGLQSAIDALSGYGQQPGQVLGQIGAVQQNIRAIGNLQQYQQLPTTPLGQYYSIQAGETARVSDALQQYGNYKGIQASNLQNLINSLQSYEGGVLGRQSTIAQQYMGLATAPYSQATSMSQLAQQYGQLAQQQASYASPGQAAGMSPVAGTMTGALGGAATGAMIGSAIPGVGTAIGALAGGLMGATGGYAATA